MKCKVIAFIASVVLVGGLNSAGADQAPSADQRGRIEMELKKAGFTTWKGIDMDDGRWEVDDAVDAQGRRFDLKLDAQNYTITSREAD